MNSCTPIPWNSSNNVSILLMKFGFTIFYFDCHRYTFYYYWFCFWSDYNFLFSYKYWFNSFRHFDTLNCGFLFNHIMNWKFKIISFLFKLSIFMVLSIIRRWSKFVPWYYFLPFWLVESLSRFKFLTPLSKLNLWLYIFNLTFFSLGILLQIIGAPLFFTSLHFTRNNWSDLRCFVAYKSFFCPYMFIFWLRNSFMCYKLQIYLICIQIIINGSAIFHLFM
jgi:hypothetical protein